MTATPPKCHPHFCPFDSPACPTQCDCVCNRIKPDCISVTAQQALNIPVSPFTNIIIRYKGLDVDCGNLCVASLIDNQTTWDIWFGKLKFQRSDTGVPVGGISTRERIFGIPYDPLQRFCHPCSSKRY
ncbi:uncharacterized protein CEXT_638591 [Caerostris extrusa]|uniref:Tectonic domain-containing protein n=1 Tax=Caerostris extrusa TaxID=172846 RepID=A0AAV4T4J6_CAEEX|nr:uncharacterized protein CEXT_638591 [Caerostris extrusa]